MTNKTTMQKWTVCAAVIVALVVLVAALAVAGLHMPSQTTSAEPQGGGEAAVGFGKVTDDSQIKSENIDQCTLEGAKLWVTLFWDDVKDKAYSFAELVDLDAIFARLHLHNPGLRDFLKTFRSAVLAGDWDSADSVILKQEVRIKGARAKLKNKSKYPADKWIGGYRLDYRFTDARRLIMDIRKGGAHV